MASFFRLTCCPLMLILFWVFGLSSTADASVLDSIRKRADGAGPSHLIWMSGPASGSPGNDVIAIVDPLFAAVRFLAVQRDPNAPLKDRLTDFGACSLPINFQPWRVLHFRDYVRIEGMPNPGINRQNAKEREFTTNAVIVRRDFVQDSRHAERMKAASAIGGKDWDPAKAIPCGEFKEALEPVTKNMSYSAARGVSHPNRTIIISNKQGALTPAYQLIVRAQTGDKTFLYSARELEPAGATRVVQISEGIATDDGMIRIAQRLLTFGADGSKPKQEWSFDDSYARSKLGQKPLAVLPTGELLAMGFSAAAQAFLLQSCGYLQTGSTSSPLCGRVGGEVVGRANPDTARARSGSDPVPESPTAQRVSANQIFKRVEPFSATEWTVSTSNLSDDCRLAEGCKVSSGDIFVPIRGIRLSRSSFTRKGAPYAQTIKLTDVFKFNDESVRNNFSNALANVRGGAKGTPGNLNDDFSGDVGIDCSALVQIAWGGEQSANRLDTATLQTGKDLSYRCGNRIPEPKFLRSGDAIGINVKPGGINHVVLFAAELKLDGASRSWLVLESSSSCDGVCWSVYDASFFNGWGLYRASGRKDLACPLDTAATRFSTATSIPLDIGAWRQRLRKATN